jgi:hypothetical protein
MITNDKIVSFLREAEDISIGYSEINFISVDDIADGQIGYSTDAEGNSLVTGEEGDWEEGWLVIGNDNLGDPIFIDTNDGNYPIFTAQHGQDEWLATPIADSLDKFKMILSDLKRLSIGRETPDEIEESPIPRNVLIRFFSTLKKNNNDVEIWWWEQFLENEEDEKPIVQNTKPKAKLKWWQKIFGS